MKSGIARVVALVMLTLVVGCGGPKEPEEQIRVSMVTMGDPAQRDIVITPDLDGATVEIWEYKEALDPTMPKKRDAKPIPPTKTSKIPKADYAGLWKAFPKGHIWNLADIKGGGGGTTTAAIYTVELRHSGRHVKATLEGAEQAADKSGWQIIEPVLKVAGVK